MTPKIEATTDTDRASEAVASAIEIENVSKMYNQGTTEPVEAVDDVSLSVREGEFVSIVGPSGCGKSTLLEMIAGLIPKTEGSIRVGEAEVEGPRDEIGLVFQESSLYPWRTARKNVEFGLELLGVGKAERRQRAEEMIDLVGVGGFEDAYPDELSGGMQKRVAVARALAADPDIMLMDEPFGALDEQTRLFMGEELLRIWEETGKTIVFVTHSLQESVLLSDRVAVVSNRPGRIQDVVEIDIPRPREADVIGTDQFRTAQSRIWEIIKTESNRTLTDGGGAKESKASDDPDGTGGTRDPGESGRHISISEGGRG
jgi:NitT/TauT family transport system ATP-binding protein